ncbi:MAG: MBL fold metallo-hydrolase [Vicingaceae bacterium]
MANNNSEIQLHFLGASGTVTGSKYLLETGKKKVLIDCGLFQGIKKLRLLNWEYLPVNVPEIELVLLTHGHLDHSGFLPRLMDMGFKGEVWASSPSLDVAEIILRDSAKIQEEEAAKANREGYSKHKPAKPLYNSEDAEKIIERFRSVDPSIWHTISDGLRVRFNPIGHILGATYIEIEVGKKRFVFSGDVGRVRDDLMKAPLKPRRADVLLVESTYGDRFHPDVETAKARFGKIVKSALEGGGTLIIPSFAVERAQTIMFLLWKLLEKGEIPEVPLIMDSPMSANVLKLFTRHRDWHKLTSEDCENMYKHFQIVSGIEETFEIINNKGPKVIIAGSGMITGGRVLHYLEHYIDKESTTILLVGYQAEGTRGRRLLEHAPEIKFFGKYYPVKAKVEHLNGLSAHADQTELLDWLSALENTPEKVFIVHGEAQASDAFRTKLNDTLGWEAEIPELYSIIQV